MLEQTESFKLDLSIFNDSIGRVLVGKSEATVSIINDDGKMKSTVYSHCVHYQILWMTYYLSQRLYLHWS